MESDLPTSVTAVDGFDLSQYIRDPNSHNPVVYVHKRNLKRAVSGKLVKDIPHRMQYEYQTHPQKNVYGSGNEENNIAENNKRDLVVEKTIQFAENLIPITIPPNENDSNVHYTIKTTKKSKTQVKPYNCVANKSKTEKFTKATKEFYSKNGLDNKENYSVSESINESSQNTNNNLDDTNNPSISGFSENAVHKDLKKDKTYIKTKGTIKKCINSESIEAIAGHYPDGAKLKIQLMNEKERDILYENIHAPLIKAIGECMSQMNPPKVHEDLQLIKKDIAVNSSKLEHILTRLNKIEKRLEKHEKLNSKIVYENISKLEELCEDLPDGKEDLSFEGELTQVNVFKNKLDDVGSVTAKQKTDKKENMESSFDRGELYPDSFKPPLQSSVSSAQPNRISARFCWTDVKTK